MLASAALGFINHLLDGEAWARARLQPFAGQTLRLTCGPVVFDFTITASGTFGAADSTDSPSVTFTLPASALWRIPGDRAALIAAARINGAADLAENLGFVLRNLRWEIEDDLAPLVGDIAARRLVDTGRALADWQQRSAHRFALNVADYFSVEDPMIARRNELSLFAHDVERLAQDAERLAQRFNAFSPTSR